MEPLTTSNDLINYVNSIELPQVPSRLVSAKIESLSITDDDAAAYVTAGGIIGFVAGLNGQQKEDVLNSTLLAQLAANKAFDREIDTVNWYKKYREVLEKIGWVASEFTFNKYSGSGSSVEVSKVLIELLEAIATENALLITKAAIDAVKALDGSSKAFTIWDSTTHSSSKGNFMISPCINSDGNVVMSLGCSYFSSNTVDSQFLWFNFSSSSISLYTGAQTITLNEDVYKQVREAVIKKLGDNATKYIADLDI